MKFKNVIIIIYDIHVTYTVDHMTLVYIKHTAPQKTLYTQPNRLHVKQQDSQNTSLPLKVKP